jgi:2-methylcitrate dehydratase PrpD
MPAPARAVITLRDGRRLEKFVEHAVGSVERPMSDTDLDAKVRDLCDGVPTADRTRRLVDLCRDIKRQPDARVIAEGART